MCIRTWGGGWEDGLYRSLMPLADRSGMGVERGAGDGAARPPRDNSAAHSRSPSRRVQTTHRTRDWLRAVAPAAVAAAEGAGG